MTQVSHVFTTSAMHTHWSASSMMTHAFVQPGLLECSFRLSSSVPFSLCVSIRPGHSRFITSSNISSFQPFMNPEFCCHLLTSFTSQHVSTRKSMQKSSAVQQHARCGMMRMSVHSKESKAPDENKPNKIGMFLAAHLFIIIFNFSISHMSIAETMSENHTDTEKHLMLLADAGGSESNMIITIDKPPPRSSLDSSNQASAESKAEQVRQSRENTKVTGRSATLFNKAKTNILTGNGSAAEQQLLELIQLSPNFAPAYSNLGNIYVASNRLQDAVDVYSKALNLAPMAADTSIVLLNRGSVYMALSNFDEALKDFTASLELKPSDEQVVLANRAMAYGSAGRWDSALKDFQRAVEKKSNDVEPFWLNYALALYQKDKPGEALSILYRVAAKYPQVSDVHAALAVIQFARGDLAGAESNWTLVDRPKLYTSRSYLEQDRHWPPKVVSAMDAFQKLKE